MSDLLLLGLIGGLTLLLLLTLLAFARHSGLLAGVAVSAGSPPVRNVTMAYKFHVGPYSETGRLFTESYSVCPRLRSIAIYYDNPHLVRSPLCRAGLPPPGRRWGGACCVRGVRASKEAVGKSELALQTTSSLVSELPPGAAWASVHLQECVLVFSSPRSDSLGSGLPTDL